MACPKLQLTDEVFGPPLLPAAGIAKRGEWVDLVRQDGVEKSTDVTGVTVRVKESTAQRNIEVATTVGGVVKRRVLGWPGGSADELVASRFPIADFLVIRHVVGPSGGQNAWTFVVFDLSAAGAGQCFQPDHARAVLPTGGRGAAPVLPGPQRSADPPLERVSGKCDGANRGGLPQRHGRAVDRFTR